MKNSVLLSLSLICGFLVILGLSYFAGKIIGTTEAHLENQDRGIFLNLLRPLGMLLFLFRGWLRTVSRKQIRD